MLILCRVTVQIFWGPATKERGNMKTWNFGIGIPHTTIWHNIESVAFFLLQNHPTGHQYNNSAFVASHMCSLVSNSKKCWLAQYLPYWCAHHWLLFARLNGVLTTRWSLVALKWAHCLLLALLSTHYSLIALLLCSLLITRPTVVLTAQCAQLIGHPTGVLTAHYLPYWCAHYSLLTLLLCSLLIGRPNGVLTTHYLHNWCGHCSLLALLLCSLLTGHPTVVLIAHPLDCSLLTVHYSLLALINYVLSAHC